MTADGGGPPFPLSEADQLPAERREFLKLLGFAATGSAAFVLRPISLGAAESNDWDLGFVDAELGLILASVARLLFPHPELKDSVYFQVVQDIESDMARRPALGGLLRDSATALAEQVGGDWLAASVPEQISAIESIEGSEAFFYLRNRTIESLYRNTEVWRLVGYEGSSIEHGGYINRGFDDIDWLDP